MSPTALLTHLQATGVRVEANGDRLHVVAPAGSLTPELRQALINQKVSLLAIASLQQRLLVLASHLGIPREVVDNLPPEELEAAAEQTATCEGHLDADGNLLAPGLLVFYLRELAKELR